MSKHYPERIRVLIVEDSRVVREFLTQIINHDPRLEVAGVASSAEEALSCFNRIRPDVVSMDIRLPGMNGFEATKRIMAEWPTPIVVVSASVTASDLNISMNALRAGALSVVEKPAGKTHQDYEELSERLCTQLAIMSQVKVVRQRFNSRSGRTDGFAKGDTSPPQKIVNRQPLRRGLGGFPSMVGIVSSTGGPKALQHLLTSLPADFPIPIALVQHITGSFHGGFVSWLNGTCPLTVRTAGHLEIPRPATVHVAPPDRHLLFDGERFRLSAADPVSAERPSGTELLRSLAENLGCRALGIVLTGMGDDGALGLLRIREAGGYTIAEDESTAVVNGMPAAAVRIGGACDSVPLGDIAARILERIRQPVEVA